ncbi:hypothetical protein [Cellulomonas palmilytica]|uniref:hypothetical protein n=1 Tax=Cellulomonas palmilytica TaxID=2608402 RepID=UPI001F35E0D7|nr:hypothetical protein [Cellulomonas palmilytica]UJP40609.1 hypothetical protein F1D97_03635 [Cellulomonas palmilytica]
MSTTSEAPAHSDAPVASDVPVASHAPVADPEVRPTSVLRLHPLTRTVQGDRVVVGRADTGRFVAVPAVGAHALDLLEVGRAVADVTRAVTPPDADEPVDVLAFARSLVRLGFVAAVDDERAVPADDVAPAVRGLVVAPRARARWLFSRWGAALAVLSALVAVVLVVTVPDVRPDALDVFFLGTPARSLAALTLITYLLAGLHELAHVMAAAALGVPARLRITRRLYFLTFETNLTGLWALPPRRRVGPLMAGMAFDAVVLAVVLALRAAGLGPDPLLAAVALVEVSAIVVQFFVFLRSDVYAVMTALLGCTHLQRTTRLLLRRTFRRLTPDERATLAASPPRDLAVARWYRWVHAGGLLLAAWFLVVLFLPSTWHLLVWMRDSLVTAGPRTWAFYEALVLGVLLLSPRLLTAAVALRDLADRRRHRR